MSYIVYLFMLVSMFLYTYIFGDENKYVDALHADSFPCFVFASVLCIALKVLNFQLMRRFMPHRLKKTVLWGVTVLLQNKSFVPIPIIDISFAVSAKLDSSGQSQAYCVFGTRIKTQIIHLQYKAKYRGVAEIGVRDIKIRDFLGFFNFSLLKKQNKVESTREITVVKQDFQA